MRYDYRKEMYMDIEEYIEREYGFEKLKTMSKGEAYEELNDILWIEDSVTGNASGSYFCNAQQAAEVLDWNLMSEAAEEFGITSKGIKEGPEYWDVTIRCYLLGEILGTVLDDIYEDLRVLEDIEYFEEEGKGDKEND